MKFTKWNAVVLLLVGLIAPSAAVLAPTASRADDTTISPTQTNARVGHYTPAAGVLFNNPLSSDGSHRINRHIRLSINSSPRGSKIRVMSWNIKSDLYVRSLIDAHKRGVSVRIIMSNGLAEDQSGSGAYSKLKTALSKGNRYRTPKMRSWVRTCKSSCRGVHGIAHAKYYIFSHTGKAHYVVMVGSANMTEVAAMNQWNDMFTVVGRTKTYSRYLKIFAESALDEYAHPPYRTFLDHDMHGWFLPYLGPAATGDPVLKVLNNVRCNGATGHSGINGHTAIRIGQTAFLNQRGIDIAAKLHSLYNAGCDIRIIYSVMGGQAGSRLWTSEGRGPIPSRHIVQDTDYDDEYDRYLHMKDMTISGVYGGQTNAHVVYNGTQNWTAVSFNSDEAGFVVHRESLERRYAKWINFLYNNPPPYYGRPIMGRTTGETDHETYSPATAHRYRSVDLY
jgi:phosphatidylserine/phosphatidylglycerophosphate/cardiolipin synthase-like enzyme